MPVLEWIQNNSALFGFTSNLIVAVLIFWFYTRKKDKERFEDEKPVIYVNVHWEWDERSHQEALGGFGRILYLEVSNIGKGLATNVEILVYGKREYTTFDDIVRVGKYTMEYLPPGHRGKYHQPYIRGGFLTGQHPQWIEIYYNFRGSRIKRPTSYRLYPEKKEDRGYELEEYFETS